jgi:hypothetical protein
MTAAFSGGVRNAKKEYGYIVRHSMTCHSLAYILLVPPPSPESMSRRHGQSAPINANLESSSRPHNSTEPYSVALRGLESPRVFNYLHSGIRVLGQGGTHTHTRTHT